MKLIRRFPIDWKAIVKETGATKGTLAYSPIYGWCVTNSNGHADFCCITPPQIDDGEILKIEGQDWCVYARSETCLPEEPVNPEP